MADQILSYKIPDAKVQIALRGLLKLYPNTEKNEDDTLKYTDAQWVKEVIRRIIIRDIGRGLSVIRNETVAQIEDTSGCVE